MQVWGLTGGAFSIRYFNTSSDAAHPIHLNVITGLVQLKQVWLWDGPIFKYHLNTVPVFGIKTNYDHELLSFKNQKFIIENNTLKSWIGMYIRNGINLTRFRELEGANNGIIIWKDRINTLKWNMTFHHWNTGRLKAQYSDDSNIQVSGIWIPTVVF